MIVMFKFSKLGSKNYKIFSVSRTSFHLTSFWLAAGAPGLTATRRWKCRSCRTRGRWLPGCRLLDCYIISPNARSVPDGALSEVWRSLGCHIFAPFSTFQDQVPSMGGQWHSGSGPPAAWQPRPGAWLVTSYFMGRKVYGYNSRYLH